ncbi:monosaccharide ABC transporter ATP-binding protein, CUT2 family [Rhizobiales bacterium GAS191]|jgi:ribose transport system ATP-binding protein|nr:monosaccharide ABC transporter ATP-binding protein, CUT2 family [Rhizobiales bacterium GAS191]
MTGPLLELIDIGKSYPGVRALDRVSLSVGRGEVVALIGENGAGKSTLMKILGGVIAPSEGHIRIDGRERASLGVAEAMAAGIAFVHQELNLFDNLDVAANVMIGREPVFAWPLRLIDRPALERKVQPLLDRLGVDFRVDTQVSELSLAQRQLLEIVKALSLEARIVIMDEPTSSLTASETGRLLRVIAELRDSGVAVIFISHRLNEVEHCADRVIVLRDGRRVGELSRAEINHEAMIRLMIGRDLKSLYTAPKQARGHAVLDIEALRTSAYPQREVSLQLHAGEILGMAGLVGAGRSELARAVFGVDAMLAGAVRLQGESLAISSPRDAISRGIFLIPEDRKRSGLVLEDDLTDNISLANLKAFSRSFLMRPSLEIDNAEQQRRALNIKTASVATQVGTLSGGNQQKVVLAKWLSMRPRIVIFDEPTRGIDVGAKSEIYALMRALADDGVAILMISSDMEEVIGVSDRIAVMHEGAISGYLPRERFSEENVMQLAVGATARRSQATC